MKISVNKELEQVFNKIDIAIRDERIRLEYKYLREIKGMSAIEARQELAAKVYITWNGRKYMLSQKSIQHIIYGLTLNGEYYADTID